MASDAPDADQAPAEVDSVRVLLVEDSDDDARLLLHELQRGGLAPLHRRVQTREDFLSALDSEQWDIVLSDYSMPGFDGLTAFGLLRERGYDVPFIFVSGHIGEERALEAMRHGVSDYLHKDNLGRLVPAIRRELADARTRRAQRETEEALRASEARLRRVTQNAPDVIYEHVYTPVPHFSFVSPAFLALTGYRPDDLYADPSLWLNLGHPDDRERLAALLKPALPEAARGELLRLYHRDGRLRWVEQSVVPLYEDNTLVGTEGIVRDVTDRKELEAQLLAAQRMESLGRLAGGIAHDFNNMLTVIHSYCNLLEHKMAPDNPLLHDVNRIVGATDRAAALVRQLLAFSRRQPRNVQLLSLNTILREFAPMLERVIGDDIDVSLRYGDALPHMRGDRSQLEQILMNLVVNARDAMPEGGRLAIETESEQLGEWVAGRALALTPGRYVRLTVSDTGEGMDETVRARIFDPFFTTKEVGKGTGLGLSTVYGIVKQMEGDIWVYSEQNIGTTFKIYLPSAPENAQAVDRSDAQAPPPGHGVVLLVEDEDMVREATEEILAANGYRVHSCADGAAALALCQARGAEMDLLLTDLLMPGMNGIELAERIQAMHPRIKALYSTGYTEAGLPDALKIAANLPLLHKPYSALDLLRRLAEVLAHAPASLNH